MQWWLFVMLVAIHRLSIYMNTERCSFKWAEMLYWTTPLAPHPSRKYYRTTRDVCATHTFRSLLFRLHTLNAQLLTITRILHQPSKWGFLQQGNMRDLFYLYRPILTLLIRPSAHYSWYVHNFGVKFLTIFGYCITLFHTTKKQSCMMTSLRKLVISLSLEPCW